MRTWIVDTGPLVAYLDARDPFHERVADRLGRFSGQLVTTSAVVTEAMHFVSTRPEGPRALVDLLADGGIEIYDLSRPAELRLAVALIEKYHDTPMDFADATLVLLAEALGIQEIATLDRRGFSTYRTAAGAGFEVLDHSEP